MKQLLLKWIDNHHLYIIGMLVMGWISFGLGLIIGYIAVH